ncbi:hypothetical protein CPB83DRAFT_780398 [Crepidotus variabilis]|uniref:Ubiquitin carboxyl-terminal hydrolase n=1 Tax=Crepidotus variabilis TaxID=179855 RepID=A0A9P6ETP9_9AGAR|nr:hypothetical protein CPB83DRAFT_780398 [Crepidotus variabilis]
MLASPLMPAPAMFSAQMGTEDSLHYRPAKDLETFNSLLPAPIEFIEGSSSGTLAVAEGKYEPINASPKIQKTELQGAPIPPPTPKTAPPKPVTPKPVQSPIGSTGAKFPTLSLFHGAIDLTWPSLQRHGSGLFNTGNTCFMNSALQCLLHTPPLLRLAGQHKAPECIIKDFCMICSLRQVMMKSFTGHGAFSPSPISSHLQVIAKHMRKGRQEDAHEFLRYAIDALQKSCLAGQPPKLDAKIAETTWVHKIFGGRLRSRVNCRDCGHNSDTFDRILDLSLDIFRCDSLREALKKFVAVDVLKGVDKYKCEKCKKHVTAEKNFTIHEAPPVLTVHLKRFSPLGRKISHLLQYDERLTLQPFMSEGSFGPTYSLFGVICHAGGGPNSGHYYAFVKGHQGTWYEMNDDSVTTCNIPTGKKNAYMLFYIQTKGQTLEAAVKAPIKGANGAPMRTGLAAGMKKKPQKAVKEEGTAAEDEEDKGIKIEGGSRFIGPLMPALEISGTKPSSSPTSPLDPQAAALKEKIAAVKKRNAARAMAALNNYTSDEDGDVSQSTKKDGNPMDVDPKAKRKDEETAEVDNNDDALPRPSSPPSSSVPPPSSDNTTPTVPAARFYAKAEKTKKRKFAESEAENANSSRNFISPVQARSRDYGSSNPFSRPLKKRRPRGI